MAMQGNKNGKKKNGERNNAFERIVNNNVYGTFIFTLLKRNKNTEVPNARQVGTSALKLNAWDVIV